MSSQLKASIIVVARALTTTAWYKSQTPPHHASVFLQFHSFSALNFFYVQDLLLLFSGRKAPNCSIYNIFSVFFM